MAQNDIVINVKTAGAEQSARSISQVNNSIRNIGDVAGGVLVAGALQGLANQMIGLATSGFGLTKGLENAEIGFVTLLGSAEKADAVLERIKKEASATPFDMVGLVENTQALTAITKNGDKAVDVLLDVGKAIAASGKGMAEMNRVVINLQQIASTGKVTEMDIRQMQGAIPIFNDILAGAGLTTEALKESTNAGELLFEAFRKAGTEGITKDAFSNAAGSFDQLFSTMMDSFSILGSDIIQATGIYDGIKGILSITTQLATVGGNNLIKFIDLIKSSFNGIPTILNSQFGVINKEGEKIKTILESIGNAFNINISVFAENNRRIIQQITELWIQYSQIVIDYANKLWTSIESATTTIVNFLFEHREVIASLIIGTIDNIMGLISFIIEQISIVTDQVTSVVKLFDELGKGFSKLFESPIEAIQIFGNAFKDFFLTQLESGIDLVNNLIGLINQLTGASIPQISKTINKTEQNLSKLQTGGSSVAITQETPIHTITAPSSSKKVANQQLFLTGTPKFAGGGIVSGNSYTGDRVTARINSGEMILNKEQQLSLFNMIKSGAGGIIIHNMTVIANDVNDFRKSLSEINSSTFNGFNLGIA